MNILIFGLGVHGGGFERARYFLSHGSKVRITDSRSREELGGGLDYLEKLGAEISVGELRKDDFEWADLTVKSQSVKLGNEYLKFSGKVTNDFAYFYENPAIEGIHLIIVTGDQKTVTASSVCHSLNRIGHKTRRCGSMGNSPLTELSLIENGDKPEYLVVEMSAWQLRDTLYFMDDFRRVCDLVVFSSENEISDELSAFFANGKVKNIVCTRELSSLVKAKLSKSRLRNVSTIESYRSKIKSLLPAEMICSYAALRKLGLAEQDALNSLKSFKGVPGRVELIRRTDNAMYFNATSASIPYAIDFSLKNFDGLPVHIICGGGDSLIDATPMISGLKRCASVHLLSGVFTDGCLKPLLEEDSVPFSGPFDSMDEALLSVQSKLNKRSGLIEVVIFSPGCINYTQIQTGLDWETQFEYAVNNLI